MRFASRAVATAQPFPTLRVAVGVAALLLSGVGAVAQQDSLSQQFDDIRNAVGLGKERPPMDFNERPPLVVPPSNALPPPGNADIDRLPVNDPDAIARRKALVDPRRPVPPSDPGASAAGRDSRAYLVDPPSGMRDPDAVAADITHDRGAAAPAKHAKARKRKHKAVASE